MALLSCDWSFFHMLTLTNLNYWVTEIDYKIDDICYLSCLAKDGESFNFPKG